MMRHLKMRPYAQRANGLTLVELLITLTIIAMVGAIATPIYIGQQQRAYLFIARDDARKVGLEIETIATEYATFGSLPGSVTVTQDGFLQFTTMSGAYPTATGPGVTTVTAPLSSGSALTAYFGSGDSMNWCVQVSNNGSIGIYTNEGPKNTATVCKSDGTAG